MNLEIFSHSKYKNQRLNGDDVFLHIPDKIYAVFDGATDALGTKFDGVSVGRVVAYTVASEISNLIFNVEMDETTPLTVILERLRNSLFNKFNQMGWEFLPSTTTAMVYEFEDCYRIIAIGDSSIRINGSKTYSKKKIIDQVSTSARVWVFNHFKKILEKENDEIELLVRKVIYKGLNLAVEEAVLTPENVEEIVEVATKFSDVVGQENEVKEFLSAGIQSQYKYANNADSILGYGCFKLN